MVADLLFTMQSTYGLYMKQGNAPNPGHTKKDLSEVTHQWHDWAMSVSTLGANDFVHRANRIA